MIDFNKLIKSAIDNDCQEFSDEQLECFLKDAKIDLKQKYTKPTPVVSFIEDEGKVIEVLTPQNISMTIGMAKSKKTFFSSIIAASLIGCKDFAIKGYLGEKLLIYVDTEQSQYHASRVAHRIKKLSICDENKFIYLGLRGFEPEKIIAIIEYILKKNNVGLMILDGIVDCVYSMNDEIESKKFVLKLMALTATHNCHINGILHTGKDNQNPLGHLGGFMVRKSETVFRIQKFNDNGESEVIAEMTRNEQFKSWNFFVNKEGMPQRVEMPIGFYNQKEPEILANRYEPIEHNTNFDKDFPF